MSTSQEMKLSFCPYQSNANFPLFQTFLRIYEFMNLCICFRLFFYTFLFFFNYLKYENKDSPTVLDLLVILSSYQLSIFLSIFVCVWYYQYCNAYMMIVVYVPSCYSQKLALSAPGYKGYKYLLIFGLVSDLLYLLY